MKSISKKLFSLLLSAMLLLSVSGIAALAESTTKMHVTLRIEGINENMFYKTVEVPFTTSLTLQTALTYIDAQEDSIDITGIETAYITDINGDASGKFGGYDGWIYTVNGLEATVGIDGCALKDGDSVVLYYGDPYGVGMQYPVADTSKIADGIIKFSSSDTTYDAQYNATVTVNPVVGAAVTWFFGNSSATYTTDANGEIKIAAAQLTEGSHVVQISKKNADGIPLVLRFASNNAVSIEATSSQLASSSQAEVSSAQTSSVQTPSPQTGEGNNLEIYLIIISIAGLAAIATVVKGRKHTDEK